MVTSRMLGVFGDNADTRQGFLAAIGMRGGGVNGRGDRYKFYAARLISSASAR